ncbi:MAG: hypothetical protein RLY30_1073 [Pseudomonadota bacterium]
MKTTARLILSSITCLGLAACSSVNLDENAPKGPAPIVQAGEAPKPAADGAGATAPTSQAPMAKGLSSLTPTDLQSAGFSADGRASVYFEFDQTVIRRQDQPIVEGAAVLLKGPSQVTLVVEGNTDDRGTSEYNLALGQRRAETVKRALLVLGVEESRVDAVSNGEEKPRKAGSAESDHAENRRADLILR